MEKGSLKDKCPACGVQAKMFEPYIEKVSPRRKFILSLDIHPVLVHFPQAFVVTIFIMTILILLVKGDLQNSLKTTVTVLSFCLPYVVAIAILAGLYDGQIRFKRVTTPLLIKKIILGSLFFLFSIAALLLTQIIKLETDVSIYLFLCSITGGLICGSLLGLLGSKLINAKFPG